MADPEIPKKRSLFKRPAWSSAQDDESDEEGVDFFSRAKDLYPIKVAEEERKRQKKLEKTTESSQRKSVSASAERKYSKSPELKRRRISSQAEGSSSNSSPAIDDGHEPAWNRRPSTQSSPASRRSGSSQSKLQASPTTLTERYSRELTNEKITKTVPKSTGFISLMSDSEDDVHANSSTVKNPSAQSFTIDDDENSDDFNSVPVPEEDDSAVSDEEFPELVQKAREREQKKALERLNAEKSFAEQNHTAGNTLPIDDVFEEIPTVAVDPVVEILVTSILEGTKAMIFRRKISQPLKPVREGWVTKQITTVELRPSVFLTWKGRRLYDVSTCAFLGLRADLDGNVSSAGNKLDENGRLHLEAWTNDTFMAYQKKMTRGQNTEEPDDEEVHVDMIKLILKAKNKEAIMLKVKPTTSIQKLVACVRTTHEVPDDKDVLLFFDGDKLDPDSNVGDTELGDRDGVDVHIR